MGAQDRGVENPVSPRNVIRQFYVKPPFMAGPEEELLSSMLSLRVGELVSGRLRALAQLAWGCPR